MSPRNVLRTLTTALLAATVAIAWELSPAPASGNIPSVNQELMPGGRNALGVPKAGPAVRKAALGAHQAAAGAGAVPQGFSSETMAVNGTNLHYVSGGGGRGLVLLHGFPEDWSVYARIMPRLAEKFQVVAVDLRGLGGSEPTAKGYDVATLAEDIFELCQRLDLEKPYVAGPDLGGGIAYALARLHPGAVRGVMLLDTAVAGIDPWDRIVADASQWRVRFHQRPGLAERLLPGREAIYFNDLFKEYTADPKAVDRQDVERYASAYRGPGQLAAALAMYRAFPDNERFGRQNRGALDVEITITGGAVPGKSLAPWLDQIARGLQQTGLTNAVMVRRLAGSGHYVVDEKPNEIAGLIERQASKDDREPLRASKENYNVISF